MTNSIAVLIPSRGRPDGLRDAVHSLRRTVTFPGRLDIRVAADPDDTQTIAVAIRLGVLFWVAPERYGYGRLWEYFNGMLPAGVPLPDWSLLFNDDAIMTSDGWDVELDQVPDHCLVADFANHHSPGLVTFPAVRRRALEYFDGRFVPQRLETVHIDSVWQELARRSGTMSPTLRSFIRHNRPDIAGTVPDQTYLEGRKCLDHERFYSPEFQSALSDVATWVYDHERLRNMRNR